MMEAIRVDHNSAGPCHSCNDDHAAVQSSLSKFEVIVGGYRVILCWDCAHDFRRVLKAVTIGGLRRAVR